MTSNYRYESTHRPVSIGTYPKRGVVDIWNYKGGRQEVYDEDGNKIMSWGYIEYNRMLTEKEMADYELAYSGEFLVPDLPI